MDEGLVLFLERKVLEYNQPSFIQADPISIPHRFQQPADIEIAALFAALFAWGQRTTIIQKAGQLMQLMDAAPYDFICNHEESDLNRFLAFKHRTFTPTDILYLIHFLRKHYKQHPSLEVAFTQGMHPGDTHIAGALDGFYTYCFDDPDAPKRTRKHIAAPMKKATCKRLNMFLRWMVRNDEAGVDFGLWKQIQPYQLVIPIDVHVARVARRFQLLSRQQTDWQAAVELTAVLKELDPADPVKFDFALFALGVVEKF
jgi:uncharacterized protein (TIGR02757 family)